MSLSLTVLKAEKIINLNKKTNTTRRLDIWTFSEKNSSPEFYYHVASAKGSQPPSSFVRKPAHGPILSLLKNWNYKITKKSFPSVISQSENEQASPKYLILFKNTFRFNVAVLFTCTKMLTGLLVPRLTVIDGVTSGIGTLFLQHRKVLRVFQI